MVDEHAQHSRLRLGLGQLEATVLIVEHGLAERLAFASVGDGFLEQGLDGLRRANGDHQPFASQLVSEVAEALVLIAEPIGRRNPHIAEEKLRRVLPLQPDLFELAPLAEAGGAFFDADQGDFLAARGGLHLGGGDHQIGVDAVGDEGLLTIQNVVVAVAPRRHAQ